MAATRHAAVKRAHVNNMSAADDEADKNNDGEFNVVKNKRRRRQDQWQQRSRQPTKKSTQSQQLMQDVIESVASQRSHHNSSSDSDSSEMSCCDDNYLLPVDSNTSADEIKRLQSTVKTLQSQVDFLLSFLGITQSAVPTNTKAAGTLKNKTTDIPVASNSGTYAAAAAVGVHKLQGPVREAVLTTMYSELHARESMHNNLVIYGLAPVSGSSDSDIVIDVCVAEFGFKPDIVKTTRLGKINPGKTQPLLVSLKTIKKPNIY